MKKKFYLIILIAVVSCVCSCKKSFLDVPDSDAIYRQAYVKDLATLQHFLNGIYVELASVLYNGATVIYPDIAADNAKPMASIASPFYDWSLIGNEDQALRTTPFSENANGTWLTGYRIIRDCSFVLEHVERYRNENAAKADAVKGAALGLRAMVHFILVNMFAQTYGYTPTASHPGVPYVKSSDWRQAVQRNTVKEVYDQMMVDLKDAMAVLPAGKQSALTFNRNAAVALLARICLFSGNYEQAKNYARLVVAEVPMMSGADYPARLFTPSETEALFQLTPSSLNNQLTFFGGAYYRIPYFSATQDIADLLRASASDVRRNWVQQDGADWLVKKYPEGVDPGFLNPPSSYYQTLLRSSEMYLTAAEAYAQLNRPDSANYYLNAIRQRADALASSLALGGSALMDAIMTERRKELAFEGGRMFDLQRWHKSIVRQDAPAIVQTLPYPSSRAVCPLPGTDVGEGKLAQNEGY